MLTASTFTADTKYMYGGRRSTTGTCRRRCPRPHPRSTCSTASGPLPNAIAEGGKPVSWIDDRSTCVDDRSTGLVSAGRLQQCLPTRAVVVPSPHTFYLNFGLALEPFRKIHGSMPREKVPGEHMFNRVRSTTERHRYCLRKLVYLVIYESG